MESLQVVTLVGRPKTLRKAHNFFFPSCRVELILPISRALAETGVAVGKVLAISLWQQGH